MRGSERERNLITVYMIGARGVSNLLMIRISCTRYIYIEYDEDDDDNDDGHRRIVHGLIHTHTHTHLLDRRYREKKINLVEG